MNARRTEPLAAWWLAAPAGVALVAAGIFAGRASVQPAAATVTREQKSAPKPADERRFALLEQEVSRLRAAVAAAPRVGADEPAAEPAAEREPGAEQVAAEPIDPVEAERVLDEARAEFLQGLDKRLDTEPIDKRWRAETEPVISQLLPEKLGAGVQLNDVFCGSSMCRAKVTHPGSPRLSGDRLADFMLQRGSLGTMQVQFDTRQDGTTTLYFMRGEH